MLKTIIIAALAALLLTAGAAIGSAGSTAWAHYHKGVYCKSTQQSVICIRDDGEGYGMAYNQDFILVTNANNKRVFLRYQP